jgi:hypothetical protein
MLQKMGFRELIEANADLPLNIAEMCHYYRKAILIKIYLH